MSVSEVGFLKQYQPTTPTISLVEVAPGWKLYVEESGNPKGIPAVFFHGGPGITFRNTDHQWFDPERYRIIVFQQRGTSRCEPSAEDFKTPSDTFKDVTIDTLATDIETLRKKLQIDKWLVFGGSWGSTLSVFYAQEFPESCLGVVVRGIFLATHKENALFVEAARHARQGGEKWKPEVLKRLECYPKEQSIHATLEDPPSIYAAYRELCVLRDDKTAQRIWAAFEDFVDKYSDMEQYDRVMTDELATTAQERSIGIWETLLMDSVSRIYNLLEKARLEKLRGLPVQVVQGAQDNLCHPSIAQELVDGLKAAGCDVKYALVEGGTHSPYEHPGMTDALVRATDTFAQHKHF